MNLKHGLCGSILCASVVLGAGLTGVGCDRNDTPKATTNTPVPPPTAADVRQRAAEAENKARAAAGLPPKDANAAANTAATTADKANDAASNAAANVKDAAGDAKTAATDAMDKVKAQGNDLLAKLQTAISNNKLDEGQTYVDAFEKIKDNVPAEVKAKYESLKTQFAAAKAKAAEPNK